MNSVGNFELSLKLDRLILPFTSSKYEPGKKATMDTNYVSLYNFDLQKLLILPGKLQL